MTVPDGRHRCKCGYWSDDQDRFAAHLSLDQYDHEEVGDPFPPVQEFSPGDKVWPQEGPMVLQHAPQTVIATYRHPVAGDWLWLDDGNCGFRSSAAEHWTTEEPDEAELAARAERVAENAAGHGGRSAFPNPCPICGAADEHEEAMRPLLGFSPATVCPHPEQPGHGTGCCCAGRPKQPWRARPRFPALTEVFAKLAWCGDVIKDDCTHIMTGGCPFACFSGPCVFGTGEEVADGT